MPLSPSNPVLKLQILASAKIISASVKTKLDSEVSMLSAQYPQAATQLSNLFAQTDADLVACTTRIQNAINAVAVTDPDRVAFASQAETDAKA